MRKCPQCWKERPLADFESTVTEGRYVNWCISCRKHYRQTNPEARSWRGGKEDAGPLRVRFYTDSKNRKTGPIPQTMSSPGTCPTSCPWYGGGGCYAEYHILGYRWREVPEVGHTWSAFVGNVRMLEPGTVWRHNVAGDLPGRDGLIDIGKLDSLREAAAHTRGFTYTHKPMTERNRRAIEAVNRQAMVHRRGLVINASVDGAENVDAVAAVFPGPLSVALSSDAPAKQTTPGGRTIIVCPAQTSEGVTCKSCALCAKAWRKVVVGFRAHGQSSKRISLKLLQGNLPFT